MRQFWERRWVRWSVYGWWTSLVFVLSLVWMASCARVRDAAYRYVPDRDTCTEVRRRRSACAQTRGS